jgi:hypothetical protein
VDGIGRSRVAIFAAISGGRVASLASISSSVAFWTARRARINLGEAARTALAAPAGDATCGEMSAFARLRRYGAEKASRTSGAKRPPSSPTAATASATNVARRAADSDAAKVCKCGIPIL